MTKNFLGTVQQGCTLPEKHKLLVTYFSKYCNQTSGKQEDLPHKFS